MSCKDREILMVPEFLDVYQCNPTGNAFAMWVRCSLGIECSRL